MIDTSDLRGTVRRMGLGIFTEVAAAHEQLASTLADSPTTWWALIAATISIDLLVAARRRKKRRLQLRAARTGPRDNRQPEGIFDEAQLLEVNPSTGNRLGVFENTVPVLADATSAKPARRSGTPNPHEIPDERVVATTGPTLLPRRQGAKVDLLELWKLSLFDELMAAAHLAGDRRGPALALAAQAALSRGDRRGMSPLRELLDSNLEDQVTAEQGALLQLPLAVPHLGIARTLPWSRSAAGCVLAADDLKAGDAETAYGTLLDIPDDPTVCILRAQAALDARWPDRAADAVAAGRGLGELPDRERVTFQLLEGCIELARGNLQDATLLLTPPENLLESLPAPLIAHMLRERSRAYQAAGNTIDAWADREAADTWHARDPSAP